MLSPSYSPLPSKYIYLHILYYRTHFLSHSLYVQTISRYAEQCNALQRRLTELESAYIKVTEAHAEAQMALETGAMIDFMVLFLLLHELFMHKLSL